MLEFDLDQTVPSASMLQELIEDEPACEIALPQVFVQPTLTLLQRGKIPQVDALAERITQRALAHPDSPLGTEYQELVAEFQPLFTWATACWDFLLSTEGCRFLPRGGDTYGLRGDYRAMTDRDFSRLAHAVFRTCVFEFAARPEAPRLAQWLRERYWPRLLEAYRRLAMPADPRQRWLTPYSYLRCVPYRFLNDVHQQLVDQTLQRLPAASRAALNTYFLHFFTEPATAEAMACPLEACAEWLRQGLVSLLIHDRLVYCLLRQIERY